MGKVERVVGEKLSGTLIKRANKVVRNGGCQLVRADEHRRLSAEQALAAAFISCYRQPRMRPKPLLLPVPIVRRLKEISHQAQTLVVVQECS